MANEVSEESIATLLKDNDRAVEQAIITLFLHQTEDERNNNDTVHSNGRGFNYHDAKPGSYWAKWLGTIQQGDDGQPIFVRNGKRLTGKHIHNARLTVRKYRTQLYLIAAEKALKAAFAKEQATYAAIGESPLALALWEQIHKEDLDPAGSAVLDDWLQEHGFSDGLLPIAKWFSRQRENEKNRQEKLAAKNNS
jgi:hypothetical protein